jgi:hypothetical protein
VSKKEDNAERKKRNREQQAEAGERFKRRVADPVKKAVTETGKRTGNRFVRIGAAGLSGLGAAGLGAAGAVEKALGDEEEAKRYFKRARNAARSAGRSGKAVVMGEPKSRLKNDEYEDPLSGNIDFAGDMLPNSERVKYRKGGAVKSSASRRADGIAKKGKTRGKFV